MSQARVSCLLAFVALASNASGQGPVEAKAGGDDTARAGKPVVTFSGHTQGVMSLAFSADGNRILSSGWRDSRLWDSATGSEIEASGEGAEAVVFSADGRRLAILSRPAPKVSRLAIRDAAGGRDLWSVDPNNRGQAVGDQTGVNLVAFSPDGRWVATGGSVADKTVRWGHYGVVQIWDVETGRNSHRFDGLHFGAPVVTFSPDGKYLAAGLDGDNGCVREKGEIRVWDVLSGKQLHTLELQEKIEPYYPDCTVVDLAFSPDGERLLSLSKNGWGRLRTYELASGRLIRSMRLETAVRRVVAFRPDAGRLAIARGARNDDGFVRVWDTGTGERTQEFRSDDIHTIHAVAFSPDGRRIAAGGDDAYKPGRTGSTFKSMVKVWDCTED